MKTTLLAILLVWAGVAWAGEFGGPVLTVGTNSFTILGRERLPVTVITTSNTLFNVPGAKAAFKDLKPGALAHGYGTNDGTNWIAKSVHIIVINR